MRYFNITGNQLESLKYSANATEGSPAGGTNLDSENTDELSLTGESRPGGGLTALIQNVDEHLFQCEGENSVVINKMEQNKENYSKREDDSSSKLRKIEYYKTESKEETTLHNSDYSQTCSPKKLLCQGVLTNQSLNISYDHKDESVETKLSERFSYKRFQRPTKLIDNTSEPLSREETVSNDSSFSRSVEVIRIDSGYMSDTEMSTDGDTPTSTQSVIRGQTTPSTSRNFSLLQGSAVGSKVRLESVLHQSCQCHTSRHVSEVYYFDHLRRPGFFLLVVMRIRCSINPLACFVLFCFFLLMARLSFLVQFFL